MSSDERPATENHETGRVAELIVCAEPLLHPNHRDDLRCSGLSDATIAAWGCFSITPENAHLLRGFAKGVRPPGLALPILPPGVQDPVGFAYKPDQPRIFEKNGKARVHKYELPRGYMNRIHVPRRVQRVFRDLDGREGRIRLVLTEGQKKAEKAAQEDIDCLALLGVWNWFAKFGGESVPIPDLLAIDWTRYNVEIVFDSDTANNPQVRRAERALAKWVMQRGGNVSIIRLPAGEDGAKVGLDDYLLGHTVAEFESLPRLPADLEPALEDAVHGLAADTEKTERNRILGRISAEERDPGEQERLFKIAAQLTKISLRALRSSAKAEATRVQTERRETEPSPRPLTPEELEAVQERARQKRDAEVDAILDAAKNRITLRAQNAVDDQLVYLCSLGDTGMLIVTSQGQVAPSTSRPDGCVVTQPPPDASPMTADGIARFRRGEAVSAVSLFKELRDYFKRHLVFQHACIPGVLALWTAGTYAHTLFHYYGYVWLTSLGPSHGKSLLARILSALAFNATRPQTDPTPATIFRDVEANSRTLVLDEIENLDPEKKGELLSLLNAGFESGTQASRMVPSGDGWKIQRFDVFSPKVIAGINQLPRPLQSRVFQIIMPKKKPTEEIEPFEPDRDAQWLARKRDDAGIFALRNAQKIKTLYEGRDQLVPRYHGDGTKAVDIRLRDILAPIYAIAAAVDHESGDLIATPDLNRFAGLQAGVRRSDGVGDYALAAHALFNWAEPRWEDGEALIRTDEAVKLFGESEIDWAATPAGAKSLLRKLGGDNKATYWNGKTVRGYVFCQEELKDVVERHPLSTESPIHAKAKR